ncbi:neuronal acetylcholine receptor subunit alpha-7 [Caerostris darwini]|uniref:Neuronal acetylcholine receptor subunit alpha-7 n=1 Tax=Caerostris darwini TaxID=1538125 RepID=A0AAV4RPQ3_9ARAC|nr:neuronal acetylcholine receptor subunit alpha-7 [Caerostris darwini]
MSFLIVLLTCFIASPSFAEVLARKPFTDRDLREFLFKDYDKLVRPVAQPNDSVNVTFDLVPISIRDLDTKNQVLIMDALMMVSWKDFYLKWNPEEFNHIGQLCLPHQEIWKPDLAIYTA